MNQPVDKTFRDVFLTAIDWFRFLWSKRRYYIICGILGMGLGLIYALKTKITYTARLTFVMEDEKSGGGMSGAFGLASSLGFDLGSSAGDAFSGLNLLELIKSRKIIEETLLQPLEIDGKKTSVVDHYIDITGMRKAWGDDPVFKNIRFIPNANREKFGIVQDSVLGTIYNSLMMNSVNVYQKDKKVGIFTIEVKSGNEIFAKMFTEKLARQVSEYYVEIKSRKAKLNVEILQRQADSVRNELNSALGGVAAATDNTFNLNAGLAVKRVPSMRRQVDVQVNTAVLSQLVANLEVAKVSLRKETPLIQTIDVPRLPLEKERMSRSITMLKGLLASIFFLTIILVIRRLIKNLLAQ